MSQPKIILTQEEGVALAQSYLQNLKKCFAANDFSSNRAFLADKLSWGWSGGVKGKGSQDEFLALMAQTWQPLVSQFLPSSPFVVVDSHSGDVSVTFDITLILDGRGAVPINSASTWSGHNLFEMRVNADKKVVHFRGAFNSKDAHMQAAIGAIMKATKQTPPKQPVMPEIISREEGVALAHKLLNSMRTGFAANDFTENRKFLASKLSWDWSGGVSGKGTQDDYFKLLGSTWQPLVSQWLPGRPYVVVDTAAGVVSISFQLTCHIDGRGAVPISSTSTFLGDGNLFEFHVDSNKKVTRFRGVWNPANAELKAAVAAVVQAKSADSIITQEEGVALAHSFLQDVQHCFASNDFSSNRAFLADKLSWGWSGGVKGEGSQDEFIALMGQTWQPLVSQFLPSSASVVVDEVSGSIIVTFDIVLLLDGRGAVPINSASTWSGQNLFEMRVNADKKITFFRGAFDSKDAHMQAAIGAIMKATKQTPPKQPVLPEIISREDGVALAHKILNSMRTGFAANDFTENRKFLASKLSWDWSGGVSGKGSQDDYFKVLGSTWQPLVSQFLPVKPYVVVDTAAGVVSVSFTLMCHIDGRGTVPISSTSTFLGDGNVFEFQVDSNKKVTRFRGLWNPANAELKAAIGAVMKAKSEAGKKQHGRTNSSKSVYGKVHNHSHRANATGRRRSSHAKRQAPPAGA